MVRHPKSRSLSPIRLLGLQIRIHGSYYSLGYFVRVDAAAAEPLHPYACGVHTMSRRQRNFGRHHTLFRAIDVAICTLCALLPSVMLTPYLVLDALATSYILARVHLDGAGISPFAK